jgi:3-hydroxyacyl-[acyl-carrier-protein] dehydratase
MHLLPHRDPIQYIDRVEIREPERAVGYWHVPPGHPVLTGHFPDAPIWPAHLTAEMAAQVAGVLLLVDGNEIGDRVATLLASSFKLSGAVFPDDDLEVEVYAEGAEAVWQASVCGLRVADGFLAFKLIPRSTFERMMARRGNTRRKAVERQTVSA